MKKLFISSIASVIIGCISLGASTIAADPYGFAAAKSLSGCSPVTVACVVSGFGTSPMVFTGTHDKIEHRFGS